MGYFTDLVKRKPYELKPEQQKSYPTTPISVAPQKKGFFQNLLESVKTGSFLPEPSEELKGLVQKKVELAPATKQVLDILELKGITSFAEKGFKGYFEEFAKAKPQKPEELVLGFLPVTGIEEYSKEIITQIAKEKAPQVIAGLLKKLGGVADDIISELSQKLSKIKIPAEVESVISKAIKTAPEAQKGVAIALKAKKGIIPKELEPLAVEARKYKNAEEFNTRYVQAGATGKLTKIEQKTINKLYPDERPFTEKVKDVVPKQIQDFYTQATKGIKEVKPTIVEKIPESIFLPKESKQIKPTKTIIRQTTGQVKDVELRQLNEKLRIQEQSARKGAIAGKKEAIEEVKAIQEERKFLVSIKTVMLEGLEKEKNQIRKQIGFERFTKELDSGILSRIKEKHGIKEWSNANKEQLQSVLDDLRLLKKGDKMLPKGQVEALKEFGIKITTTKEEAAKMLGEITEWKQKTKTRFFNFFKTIDQKITNTAGKDAEKVKNILTRPREEAVAKMFKEEIKLKTAMKDMLDNFGINNAKDRGLIMRFGEKRMSLEELKKANPNKWQDIIEADKWFRKQYDELLETTNAEMRRLKYPEDKLIPKRQDYYTHAQEFGKMWEVIKNTGGDISPVLEQVSEFTRPNRKFNPFALRRKGGMEFVEDAGKAFEAYLTPVLNNKYLTESIIRHRAVADILAHNTLQSKNLNQFIGSLRYAADNLAGKTNPFDRPLMNFVVGRKGIQLLNMVAQRFGKNRIIGNIGSALMQISGIPNSVLRNNFIRTSKGLLTQAVSPLLGANDPLLKSKALLIRYGEKGLQHGETVFPTITEKGGKLLGIPFVVIEKNISKALWRASFDNAYSQGFRGQELMTKADEIFKSVVGSRAIGEKAMAFESGVLSIPLQFQLEVNTHAQLWKEEVFSKIFKDPVKATRAAIETSITLFLMNTLFEKTMGRTPLPDPIRAIGEATEADSWFEGVGRIAGEGLSSVAGGQFIANLMPEEFKKKYFGRSEVGIYPGGIPIATALSGGFKTPSNYVYDFILPYGGGQLKKILQGIEGLDKMGSYNKAGKLQFPINQNQWLQVITFGKYSTKEAKEYFDKQRQPLTEKQTVEYFLRTQKGENPQEVYKDIMKDRIRKEYEREIIKEVIKKVKDKPDEGFALIQLWKKQGIISNKMEEDIINGLK